MATRAKKPQDETPDTAPVEGEVVDAPEQDDDSDQGPLLDLAVIHNRKDYVRAPNGKDYYLRTKGLGALKHHEFMHLSERDGELLRKKELTPHEAQEMEAGLQRMLEICWEAPASERKKVEGENARAVCRVFQDASQPGAEGMQAQLERLTAALETQNALNALSISES